MAHKNSVCNNVEKNVSFYDHIFLSKWSKEGESWIFFFLQIKVKQCVQSLSFPPCVALPASFGFGCGNFCATNSSDEKNVRHDCLLNLLICGPDPISHYAASATNASEEIFLFFFFVKGGFLFTSCFRCPACPPAIVPVAASAEQRMNSHGAARRVYISTYPPCCNKSIGSHNAHPEQTLTCSPTLASETTSCQKKKRGRNEWKGNKIYKRLAADACRFTGFWTPFVFVWFVIIVIDFSRAGKYCAKSWIRAHTDIPKKSSKSNACNVEDTQWFRCELKLGHFFRGVFVFGPQNQSLTFSARTTRRAEINHAYRGEVE